MGSGSRRQLRRSSRRGKWGFSSKDRKESNSTEARTENAGGKDCTISFEPLEASPERLQSQCNYRLFIT